MGTTFREIIEGFCGGIRNGGKLKAFIPGGSSAPILPADRIDTPADFESVAEAGSMLGSGGVIVMDNTTCMVDMARYFMEFIQDESCGKCTPCREGLIHMSMILEDICQGKGRSGDIERLEELAHIVSRTSLCGLGQTSANPVLSTIRYFRDEYEAHIYGKECPARTCPDLVKFRVDPDACKRCGACFKGCPVEAITWKKKEVAFIDQDKCIRCMTCYDRCKFDAIL